MVKTVYSRLLLKNGARHTSLTENEGEWVGQFVRRKKIKKSLEIGLAFGVSAVYIMLATKRVHYIIDPFADRDIYQGLGRKNIVRFGLAKNCRLYTETSQQVLPRLLDKRLSFDLAFVDGSHYFDDQFVDLFFLDKLLEEGGWLVWHDAWTGPVKTLASWIETNKPNYQRDYDVEPTFFVWQKQSVDKRKWHQFNKFKVYTSGKISCFI
jgi:predicted O-methyltransferase YrrM